MRRVPTLLMALRVDATRGLVLLAAAPYDEAIVDWIRTLPERRYRHRSRDWCVPARHEHLRAVSAVIGELEERGIAIQISTHAAARLSRAGIGRALLRGNAVEVAGPYSRRQLPALRSLPERSYDPDRQRWTIPLTRAGALAILMLIDDSLALVATRRAHGALERAAMSTTAISRATRDAAPASTRRSPIPHWRHYTAGPVFENPARPRIHVPGMGWCVRIRVNPAQAGKLGGSRGRPS